MATTEVSCACSRCLLPDTFPGLDIDAEHHCCFCRDHVPLDVLGEDELRKKILSRRGTDYDVLVPFSGGKDSTYVIWYAKEVLDLRVLALNYDSGLQTDMCKENMRNTCEQLDIPLVVKAVNIERQLAMVRSILRVSEAVDCFFHICGNCENGIRYSAYSTAEEYKVPFILFGSDPFAMPAHTRAFTGTRAFLAKLKKKKRAIPRVAYHLVKYTVHSALQQRELGLPLSHCVRHPLKAAPWPARDPEVIPFFQYVEWAPSKIVRVIREHLDWKSPCYRSARFDCLIHCFVNHHWLSETGVTSDGFLSSIELRNGTKDKDSAIREEEHIKETVEEECWDVVQTLGMKDYRMPYHSK